MTRNMADRVAADLHAEPRKHDWDKIGKPWRCTRLGCGYRWYWSIQAEPTGCRGTDEQETNMADPKPPTPPPGTPRPGGSGGNPRPGGSGSNAPRNPRGPGKGTT